MEQGIIKWFTPSKGYGFIQRESGEDLFVHVNDIEGEGIQPVKSGDTVEFEIAETPKGPKAIHIRQILTE